MLSRELDRIMTKPPAPYAAGWQAEYALLPDFVGFSGHFEDYPILPAFMQLLMAGHLLRKTGAVKGHASEVPTAKFTGQAKPGDTLSVICLPCARKTGAGNAWDAQLVNSCTKLPIAKFKLVFSIEQRYE